MRIFFLLVFCWSCLCADPPKALIFDYGGVVARVERKEILEFLAQSLGVSYRKIKKDFASENLYKALNEPRSFWEKYANKTLSKSWVEEFEAHKRNIVREIPHMRPLLEDLKARGFQLALLSNTNKYRARFVESMGGYNLFDPILLSCYLGVKKPDPEIYKKLLNHLEWPANQCLFIDNKEKNIEAAQKFGIDGIVFESPEQLKEELKKRDISLE